MNSFMKKMKMKSLYLKMIWMILVSVESELCSTGADPGFDEGGFG